MDMNGSYHHMIYSVQIINHIQKLYVPLEYTEVPCTCWKASSVFISTKAVPLMFPVSRCRGMFTSVMWCGWPYSIFWRTLPDISWNTLELFPMHFAVENLWIQNDMHMKAPASNATEADPAVEGPEPLRHMLRSAPAVWLRRRCRGNPSPPLSGRRCLRPEYRRWPDVAWWWHAHMAGSERICLSFWILTRSSAVCQAT